MVHVEKDWKGICRNKNYTQGCGRLLLKLSPLLLSSHPLEMNCGVKGGLRGVNCSNMERTRFVKRVLSAEHRSLDQGDAVSSRDPVESVLSVWPLLIVSHGWRDEVTCCMSSLLLKPDSPPKNFQKRSAFICTVIKKKKAVGVDRCIPSLLLSSVHVFYSLVHSDVLVFRFAEAR